jgi:glutathione S-transferase
MTGAADKAVSFFYAKLFSAALAPDFVSRCEGQIRTALAAIDRECGARVGDWWHGATPGHDDIAVACVARFIREAYPDLFDPEALPALSSHCARAEALSVFSAVEQTFTPPKG